MGLLLSYWGRWSLQEERGLRYVGGTSNSLGSYFHMEGL